MAVLCQGTWRALAEQGDISEIISADGGKCEAVLDQFTEADKDAGSGSGLPERKERS
jgi:hypothetical protein